jgi:hypothetical protein
MFGPMDLGVTNDRKRAGHEQAAQIGRARRDLGAAGGPRPGNGASLVAQPPATQAAEVDLVDLILCDRRAWARHQKGRRRDD